MLITGVENVYFRTPGSSAYVPGGEIETDSLYMILSLDYEYYTDASFPTDLFSTGLYAFSCDVPVANHLTDLSVTSNNTFNGIPAGSVLNDKLVTLTGGTIVDLLEDLQGQGMYGLYSPLEFLWTEKPTESDHTFEFLLTDNAGNTFSATSAPIIWK